ncbi:MAG TPA: zf-HC2 domain-containing protein [Thermomicrobiales bacterium]|nr:zf-HC2 domain-containing protein [Thermomicrobiales bacterium]
MVDPNRSREPAAEDGDAGSQRHLDLDALNALLDGTLDPTDGVVAEAHVARCAACAADLGELRATVGLLRGLPQYRPRRSFALGPEHATRPRPVVAAGTARLLPSVQALRVATLAVAALLLLAVAGEWTFGQAPSWPSLPQSAPVAAPADLAPTASAALAPAPAPALNEAPTARQPAPAAGGAPPSAAERAVAPGAGDALEASGDGAANGEGGAIGEDAGTGGATGASQTTDGGHPAREAPATPSPWRLAQIGLGLILLWLLVSLVGVGVVRRMRDEG